MSTAQTKISSGTIVLSRAALDLSPIRASRRFSMAILGSFVMHVMMIGLWLSMSIIRQPEILEIREVSFVDESEVVPEKKESAVKTGGAMSGEPSKAVSDVSGQASGNDGQVNAEAGAEGVDVNKVGVLGLLEGVSEDGGAGGELSLNMKEVDGVVKNLKMNRSLTAGRGQNSKAEVKDDALLALSEKGKGIDDLLKVDMSAGEGIALKKSGRVEIGGLSGTAATDGKIGARSEVSLYEVMNKNLGRLQYIFEKYLRAHPDIGGKVEVEVTINADGAVAKVLFLSSEIPIAAFQEELMAAIRRWKYGPISEGTVKVVYPLLFVKTG